MLEFQDTYYNFLAILTGIVVPTLVAGYGWGDYWGGFYYAAVLRTVLVMHCTCCIHSVVYYVGTWTFSDTAAPRDSWLVSLFTFGEGYNNFHHEFPHDYRNGVSHFAYDPAKWIIWALEKVGIVYAVKRMPDSDIKKAELLMKEKKLEELKKKLIWGPKLDLLPTISMEEYQKEAKNKRWLAVDYLIFDLSTFQAEHPGGDKILNVYFGKDASDAFNGGVYNHSNAARNHSRNLLIAKLEGRDTKFPQT